jgi:hypothetical protein
MERQGDEVHIETNEARGGSTPHIVRYVLIISLLLAIAAMSFIWITGAANTAQPEQNGPISGQAVPARQ